MKALVYHGPRDIRFESHDDPTIRSDTDAIVKVDLCAICGSDLHIFHGHGFSPDTGYCVGHEAVGEVVEVGKAVRRFRPGDKVMVSAAVGCGHCARCLAGQVNLCLTGSMNCYGLSLGLEGCQAEAFRVPAADFNATAMPDGLSATQALMLTDSMATAWFGCKNARIGPGRRVVVVGLGPIGLMAVEAAFVMGASAVYGVDLAADRRAIAQSLGATAFHPDDARAAVIEATHGRGADCAVEAVGADATIRLAIDLVGRSGAVSVIGVNQTMDFSFPMGLAFFKGIGFSIGTCSVPEHWPELVPLLQEGRLHPERFVSHTLALADGAHAYDLFDQRAEGALKMVLAP
jgi:2-desacetyl-2-hydroxyethyl bacteriochlorophyllide A dehydrogenase